MSVKVNGLDSLRAALEAHKNAAAMLVSERRRRMAHALVLALTKNIPVWSGRTVASVQVNNTGALSALAGKPTTSEARTFGATHKMSLGTEPRRAGATSKALSTVNATDYGVGKRVYVTVYSEAWGLVEKAAAPFAPGRNTAIVSQIALAAVRREFGLR
jgi:hypothetical protein